MQHMINSAVPMRRFGTPEEVADAAVFLCSGRATLSQAQFWLLMVGKQ